MGGGGGGIFQCRSSLIDGIRIGSTTSVKFGRFCTLFTIPDPDHSLLLYTSLATSLYLMLVYFIAGMCHEVFKMVESCVSEELTPEEVCRFV